MAAKSVVPQKDGIFDLPIVTVIVVILVLAGAVDIVIDGHLSPDWKQFVDQLAIPLAGLGIGRGLAARKAG